MSRVEATDADQIVLDLAGLDFIAGTGLQLILSADARCGADGSRLTLLHGPPHVRRMFEITATADRLPFADPGGGGGHRTPSRGGRRAEVAAVQRRGLRSRVSAVCH